jgi:hypothetical protein
MIVLLEVKFKQDGQKLRKLRRKLRDGNSGTDGTFSVIFDFGRRET